ncbi:AbrB/MazE/SpoVT family DNA-binding domain-containing protein [Effusibacillus dendaii]|uniref:SpoVT-AbrB domain-containing protein n=1 Tax=Effusibacillus dendaii TaxID=2743772 RepID=A0A7I8DGQ8_9BACL|nr:AbrB/MazE/SpoVT family DNA-binding domain-containing protein [Effusibacillus dendaii]BCJ87760.1 hypothetical protein skT53_27450 [Effusibacillus dendaii]
MTMRNMKEGLKPVNQKGNCFSPFEHVSFGGSKNMSVTTKVSSKGQVVIPAEIRKAIKVEEGDSLAFEVIDQGTLRVRVIRTKPLMSLFGALSARPNQPEMDFQEIRRQARYSMTEKRFSKGEGL